MPSASEYTCSYPDTSNEEPVGLADLEAALHCRLPEAALATGAGLVVGVAAGGVTAVAAAGVTDQGTGRRPDGRTVFRLASLSKIFTSGLLALSVLRGEVALTDPVNAHLPRELHLPAPDGDDVTLEQLATHTSGLVAQTRGHHDGRVPTLAGDLRDHRLAAPPGRTYAYSNFGMSLLARAVCERVGREYEELLIERICRPLGLSDVVIEAGGDQRARLAPGHTAEGQPRATPTYPDFAPSGGAYGSVADLLRFVEANLAGSPAGVAPALALARRPRFRPGDGSPAVGLGWHLTDLPGSGKCSAFHTGALPGYRAYLGLVPDAGCGVVVLANSERAIERLGTDLLDDLAGGRIGG